MGLAASSRPPTPRKPLLRVRSVSALMRGVSCDIGWYLCWRYCVSLSVPLYSGECRAAKSQTPTSWGTNMIICSTIDTSALWGVPPIGGDVCPLGIKLPRVSPWKKAGWPICPPVLCYLGSCLILVRVCALGKFASFCEPFKLRTLFALMRCPPLVLSPSHFFLCSVCLVFLKRESSGIKG